MRVEARARGHEEDAEQDALEGLDVRGDLRPVAVAREEDARGEGARRRREPRGLGEAAHAHGDEQRRRDERLRGPGLRDEVEGHLEHLVPQSEHAAEADRRLEGEELEALDARRRARARDQREEDQERRDGQVLQ